MIADNTICDALADYAVQPGDVFFLPAGRIHSIGAGCFIAEIQQTSNITYRIYDFNRKDKNGNTRELHTELSKDAIDYTLHSETERAGRIGKLPVFHDYGVRLDRTDGNGLQRIGFVCDLHLHGGCLQHCGQ